VLIGLSESYIYTGIRNQNPENGAFVIAALYIPFLVLDTFLFALKVYLLATSPAYMERDRFVWRFLKEYVLIYTLYATFL